MQVRRAVAGDAEQIARVHVLGWQQGYRGLLPQALLDGLRSRDRVPRWTGTLGAADWPGRGTWVADEGGAVLGFADFCPERDHGSDGPPVGEIASFYVAPSAWGHGVGRSLMAATVAGLAVAGYASAVLWVLDTNASAIGFYTHLGWRPDGARKPDAVGGVAITDLRYRRDLGGAGPWG